MSIKDADCDPAVALCAARDCHHSDREFVLDDLVLTRPLLERRRHHANMRAYVCFSNRPVGVKRFQAIRHCGVDVARGLVLLSGLGARALPSWDPRTRWNNLLSGLSVKRTIGPSRHANSPHPSSREGHYSTAWWSSKYPPIAFDLERTSYRCSSSGPSELAAISPDA